MGNRQKLEIIIDMEVCMGQETSANGTKIPLSFPWSFSIAIKLLAEGMLERCSIQPAGSKHSMTMKQVLLVGGLEHVLFSHILGMSSSQMTFIFSEGCLNHQPD